MDNACKLAPETQPLLEARRGEATPLSGPAVDAFLESLEERFRPDRVNAHLWHCRTKEEFELERDRLEDEDEDRHARPDLDGGTDAWFTDRN